MNEKKYPARLFVYGVVTNFLFHFFWLSIPGVILLVVGFFAKSCARVSAVILLLDLVLSIIEQIRIRKAFIDMAESNNPAYQQLQEILSKDAESRKNMESRDEDKNGN